jgi:hypothetical protein
VLDRVEIQDASGTIICTRKSEFEWIMEEPVDQKGKAADIAKLITPLEEARAEQVFDQPAPNIRAMLAKPEFQAVLTDKSAKKLTIQLSKESDGFVYARTSESPSIFKLDKQILTQLNLKPSDLILSGTPN